MKIKKLKLLLTVFFCGDKFTKTYKTEKEAEKYKKIATIVILQERIEGVLIAFVI